MESTQIESVSMMFYLYLFFIFTVNNMFFVLLYNGLNTEVVRITADCPIIDPKLIDECIKLHFKKKSDYTSNILNLTFPDGLDVEVIDLNILVKSQKISKSKYNKEHVTFFVKKSKLFKKHNYKNFIDYSNRRWTLDNLKDYLFLKKIVRYFSKNIFFSWRDLIKAEKYNKSLINIKER
mgnify:CR=1 FL=1